MAERSQEEEELACILRKGRACSRPESLKKAWGWTRVSGGRSVVMRPQGRAGLAPTGRCGPPAWTSNGKQQGRLAQLRSCKKVSTGHGIKTRRTGEGAQTGRPAELPCLVMGPVGLQSVRRFEVEAFFEDRVKGIH